MGCFHRIFYIPIMNERWIKNLILSYSRVSLNFSSHFCSLLFSNQGFWLAFAIIHDWIAKQQRFFQRVHETLLFIRHKQKAMQCHMCAMCIWISHVFIVPLLRFFSLTVGWELSHRIPGFVSWHSFVIFHWTCRERSFDKVGEEDWKVGLIYELHIWFDLSWHVSFWCVHHSMVLQT